jgi:hypothetical protein
MLQWVEEKNSTWVQSILLFCAVVFLLGRKMGMDSSAVTVQKKVPDAAVEEPDVRWAVGKSRVVFRGSPDSKRQFPQNPQP